MSELTTADKVALYGGGGLVLLGTVVIGFLEILAGTPHPVQEEGQVVHESLVPLEIRSYVIMLGLLLWGGYAIYRVVATEPASSTASPDGQVRR